MELETDLLAELIGRKYECLIGLREMGRRQWELVQAGEITRLLDLLASKQAAMANLQRIERAMDPFRKQSPEERTWRNEEARLACADRLAACESLLGEIVAQEKRCESELIRRRDEAAVRLQGAHVASQARGAYQAAPMEQGMQLDLQSGNY